VIGACVVQAARESPGSAGRTVAIRQCRARPRSQKKRARNRTLLGGGSLPEREWDHANGHKQKQVKRASEKMRFDLGVSLFFQFLFNPILRFLRKCLSDIT